MWKIINSPIVITIIAIAALFIFRATMKPKLASEIRGAYEELNSIIQDGASDAEKTKAIQQFAEEISKQFRAGFSAGFKSTEPEKNDEDKIFAAVKEKLSISGIKLVPTEWQNHEKIIFILKNDSENAISNLILNFEYFKNGEMIDCRNDWINEIKLLEPHQEIALSKSRNLPKEESDAFKSDEVKIKVTSFGLK